MKKYVLGVFFFSLMLIAGSCDVDTGENFHFEALQVTGAVVPDTFTLNQNHNLKVSFLRPDDCTFFEGFDVTSETGGFRYITAVGSVINNDECSSTNDTISANLTVTPLLNETYHLRFFIGTDAADNTQYLAFDVPVKQ